VLTQFSLLYGFGILSGQIQLIQKYYQCGIRAANQQPEFKNKLIRSDYTWAASRSCSPVLRIGRICPLRIHNQLKKIGEIINFTSSDNNCELVLRDILLALVLQAIKIIDLVSAA
jgi:hypothetical protein